MRMRISRGRERILWIVVACGLAGLAFHQAYAAQRLRTTLEGPSDLAPFVATALSQAANDARTSEAEFRARTVIATMRDGERRCVRFLSCDGGLAESTYCFADSPARLVSKSITTE